MDLQGLRDYLVIGSYLAGAFFYGMLWKELRGVKAHMDALRQSYAHYQGVFEGLELDKRVTRLEGIVADCPVRKPARAT